MTSPDPITVESHIAGNGYRSLDAQVRFSKLQPDEPLILEREPTNEYDPSAIKVSTEDGEWIGYVPAFRAKKIAPSMDLGNPIRARVGDMSDLVISYIPVPSEPADGEQG